MGRRGDRGSQRAEIHRSVAQVEAAAAHLRGMGKDLLEITAALAAASGDCRAAARFFGAAGARLQEAGSRREPVDEAFIGPWMARARGRLGEADSAAREAEGQRLGYDEAIAEVVAWLDASTARWPAG